MNGAREIGWTVAPSGCGFAGPLRCQRMQIRSIRTSSSYIVVFHCISELVRSRQPARFRPDSDIRVIIILIKRVMTMTISS
jgi:hypothetical protein